MLTVNKYMHKTETRAPEQKEGYYMKEEIEFIYNLFEFQNRDLNIRKTLVQNFVIK
jgi:hypothetical protein